MRLEDAETLARQLMDEHGLEDWKFEFDWGMDRFGCCHYDRRMIGMSRYIVPLNPESAVRDMLLHEIAHAKVGHAAGHDWRWKETAVSIGASGTRCYSPDTIVPLGRWKAVCAGCGRVVRRHCKPGSSRIACLRCGGGRWSEGFVLIGWVDEGFDPSRAGRAGDQIEMAVDQVAAVASRR